MRPQQLLLHALHVHQFLFACLLASLALVLTPLPASAHTADITKDVGTSSTIAGNTNCSLLEASHNANNDGDCTVGSETNTFNLGITVSRNDAIASFPENIEFRVAASSDAEIESVELEFGTNALACGESNTRAIPEDFSPGFSIDTQWTWNLRRTGEFPPGVTVWWRWKLSDASGEELVTPTQSLQFTDENYQWKSIETDSLSLFWYEGSTAFAQALVNAGEASLERIQQDTGVDIERKIQVYIYASSEEMQSASLFAPAWSGGRAFPSHTTVVIGIPTTSLDWGRSALAHELSHVVVGHYTFSCVDSTPPWLDEGLAVYAEGGMPSDLAEQLSSAIAEDSLLSVRALGGLFSDNRDLAILSYAQSTSLVEFLIDRYGQAQMLALLDEFKEGMPEDQALTSVYGMDRDRLDVAWHEWVGAAPPELEVQTATTPTRTPFPTLAPITGPVVAESEIQQATATAPPSPTALVATPLPPQASPGEAASSDSGTALPIIVGIGLLLAVLVAVSAWFVWRRGRSDS